MLRRVLPLPRPEKTIDQDDLQDCLENQGLRSPGNQQFCTSTASANQEADSFCTIVPKDSFPPPMKPKKSHFASVVEPQINAPPRSNISQQSPPGIVRIEMYKIIMKTAVKARANIWWRSGVVIRMPKGGRLWDKRAGNQAPHVLAYQTGNRPIWYPTTQPNL